MSRPPLTATLALLLVAASLEGQVPLPPVEAEIVHVDAVVTDGKGRAVQGLSRDDFTLFVDGRPTAIALFEAPATAPPGPGAAAAAERAASAQDTPTRPEGPLLVIHLDADNLTVAGRRRALAGLGEWVAELLSRQPARVLVTAADHGIRLLAPVTRDPAAVVRAIAEAATAPVHGMRRIEEERTVRETMRELIQGAEATLQTCTDVLPLAQSVVEAHARAREAEQLGTIEGLAGLVAALGTVPGTKLLVYVTEGLEQRPALELLHQLGEICSAASQVDLSALSFSMQRLDLSRPLQDLAARANAARVTLYPVDAAGLTAASAADVSHDSRRFTPSNRNDAVRRANLRAGPGILADETGGVAVFDRNRPVTGLEALERDLGSRYLLGFTPSGSADGMNPSAVPQGLPRNSSSAPAPPSGSADGMNPSAVPQGLRRHALRVEVRKRGLTVRHRLSYWHAEAGDELVSRTWATLLLGHEQDELGALVEVALTTREGAPELALRLRFAAARLGAEAAGASRRARLRVVIAVRGDGSDPLARREAREKTIEIPLGPEAEGAEPNWREVVVRLPFPRGEELVAVGVRDLLGGRSTYRRLVVRP